MSSVCDRESLTPVELATLLKEEIGLGADEVLDGDGQGPFF
jgi:hypothetical protein